MQHAVAVAVVAVLTVCVTEQLAPRLRLASPLLLVLVGIALSLIPATPHIEVEPELILQVVLPPLLYASALRVPAVSLRRDIAPVSLLAVTLVVATSLGVGLLLSWLVPGLGFGWAVALGAIVAPTDAVAVGVLRGGRVPPRVLMILTGESLLNDASALVILRTAIVATAGGFSLASAAGSLAWALVSALVIGAVVGVVTLRVMARIESNVITTILSFTLPFIAAVPTEAVGGSGLVAAVATGLVVGWRGPRVLAPHHRISAAMHWASVQLVLEGIVFLLMGLQLATVVAGVREDSVGLGVGFALALAVVALVLLVRSAAVAASLQRMSRRRARGEAMLDRIEELEQMVADGVELRRPGAGRRGGPRSTPRDPERFATRLRRVGADIGYHSRERMGRAEGAVLVWAGMRGAVTVAAAQTLPAETPHRPLLVFVAFAVATLSLLGQGATIGPLAARLFRPGPAADARAAEVADQRERLRDLMAGAVGHAEAPEEAPQPRAWDADVVLPTIRRKREVLLDARDDGLFDAEVIDETLAHLDALETAVLVREGRLSAG